MLEKHVCEDGVCVLEKHVRKNIVLVFLGNVARTCPECDSCNHDYL